MEDVLLTCTDQIRKSQLGQEVGPLWRFLHTGQRLVPVRVIFEYCHDELRASLGSSSRDWCRAARAALLPSGSENRGGNLGDQGLAHLLWSLLWRLEARIHQALWCVGVCRRDCVTPNYDGGRAKQSNIDSEPLSLIAPIGRAGPFGLIGSWSYREKRHEITGRDKQISELIAQRGGLARVLELTRPRGIASKRMPVAASQSPRLDSSYPGHSTVEISLCRRRLGTWRRRFWCRHPS